MESVPANYISDVNIAAGADGSGESDRFLLCRGFHLITRVMAVKMTVSSPGRSDAVNVEVLGEGGEVVASHDAVSNEPFEFVVDSPELWSPGSPHLYNLTITMGVCFSAPVANPLGVT